MVAKRRHGAGILDNLNPTKIIKAQAVKQLNKPITFTPMQVLQKTGLASKLGLPASGAGRKRRKTTKRK
jgi:hypothetical protein